MNDWSAVEPLGTARATLEPLTVHHAKEMVSVLADPSLYKYTGGHAPSLEQLVNRYSTQVIGHSPDGQQGWYNWIIRRRDSGEAIGFTQATLSHEGETTADIAWVVSPKHQGNGFATEASKSMCEWLSGCGTDLLVAYISPENLPSIGVARGLGMRPTKVVVDEEIRWES